MFLEFFGLREQPFGMTPDPAYLYVSRTHSEALQSLSVGIEDNRGFLALIAEPGMGKTTLLYQLAEGFRNSARVVLLSQTQCSSREFIEYILHDLGVDIKGMGLVAMHGKLNEILFEELLAGKRFVLVVDEAQNLDDSVLETVRMLSNFETHNTKLLQIILAGQPRLASKLAQPRLYQLRQRIAVLSRLDPFGMEETGNYIQHRLGVAGHRGEPIFDEASIAMIARQSKGVPRNINNICYHSLFLSYTRGRLKVTPETVREVVARLDIEPLASEQPVVPDLVADPEAAATAAKVAALLSAPIAPATAVPIVKDRPAKTFLTYGAGTKRGTPRWPMQSAILAVILLCGTVVVAVLGRTQSRQGLTPAVFDPSTDTLGPLPPADGSEGTTESYEADPQDTGNGQVLTVIAGPQQTLKDLTMRYVGHYDDDLSKQISSLNPDLKDPDHLEAGQLIRIPLPPGAMIKVNDTAEAATPSKTETSGNFFTKFTALLRGRR
jgi:general secretion pathway protein A